MIEYIHQKEAEEAAEEFRVDHEDRTVFESEERAQQFEKEIALGVLKEVEPKLAGIINRQVLNVVHQARS